MESHEGEDVAVPDMSQYVNAAGGVNGDAPTGTQQVVAKLLVTNPTAGSIIGKSGANIEQLQRSSGARIQLSRSGEFFPGTSDRVLLLSGSLHSVLTAIFLILEKVSRDTGAANGGKGKGPKREEGGDVSQVKLALSRRLCGLLIGAKGQTVRDFITDSGSTIRVQSLSELTPSDPERTITVSGARDQVLRAVALILNTLSTHEGYATYMETTLQLASTQGVVLPPRSSAAKSVLASVRASLTLFLSDDDVGAILGRKGQNLADIQQNARVTIRISDRSKMDPSTNEREVTVTGMYGAVKLAEAMIAEKLNQSRARASARSRDGSVHDA
mmetsp:Transcript_21751/g.47541  ORF Transcript_21751/g.47541 Transcript_21751/m.47541 type:complete len:329 (+) Transcript_21751:113-1099(+)|eukprot:CAMPEP_0202899152 /NCGR_PEP_ID=MMETSP1392-20130828/7460_1 /ASSEMBLY_ACC=CAM_ASM_000868 /TAXON_ID=225041 /ORGANISM="Chlamydomonas chlamydogama, Strain SAG 11-48b" /LENGTH=328 /DNA_ID=CAMNT_0049585263 /DNA_START=111 /DNA_END=1097 /DNA_ORIENTATION=+